jgi:hypothetical protein
VAPTTYSTRHLVLGRSRAQWTASQSKVSLEKLRASRDDQPSDDGPPKLDTGQEQLFSMYAPALVAGPHHIEVHQSVQPPDGATTSLPLDLTSSADFVVVAPRFSLPDSDIHSIYPPQGHGDHLRVLPHVVFTDEHLPWERAASKKVEPTPERNRVPWLALFVFTQDELRLLPSELKGPSKIFPSEQTQSTTLSVNMTITDLWTMVDKDRVLTPIQDNIDDPIDPATANTKTNLIFVTKDQIDDLFRSYNDDGSKKSVDTPDLVKYKYLAHVRNINTEGMTNVGVLDEFGDPVDQLFSVVVAHRTGPWTIKEPTPVVVHLVSLEGIEENIHLDNLSKSTVPYVALCSLYSWTYQCLPPESVNFYDEMKHIGSTPQVDQLLRVPYDTYKSYLISPEPATQRVGGRLQDGFTLARWRVRTGESTAAIVRGPFVPTQVSYDLQPQSTFSTDLEILDRKAGIVDVSYSLAWQLGKTMAIADQAFTASVARIRLTIHNQAMQALKANEIIQLHRSRTQVVKNLRNSIDLLGDLHNRSELDPLRKWHRPPSRPSPKLGFFDPAIQDNFLKEAKKVAKRLASTLDDPTGKKYYNEHNRPYSTDWALMLKWILDRKYFVGIPAHYLITDPAHLPSESLRFFYVDKNWVEALVDGALSICCHLEQDDDQIRTAIKTTLDDYIRMQDPDIGYAPQIPTFGFLMR